MFDNTPSTENFPNLYQHSALNQVNTVFPYVSDHGYNLDAKWLSSNAQFEAAKGKMIFFYFRTATCQAAIYRRPT